jgi:ABC-2 type transport system permease protein
MENILYLLKLEWLKLKNYTPFLVLGGMYLVLLPLMALSPLSIDLPKEMDSTNTYFMFPNVWLTIAYIGNWLVFFTLGFISVLATTNEFSNRTLRQNIISGISRTEFFYSKLYFIIALSLIATLYYAILAFLFGIVHTETLYMSRILENIDLIPRYFLMCLSFSSFGLMLGLVVRRSGIALFLFFSYCFFIERILRYLILRKIFGNGAISYAPINATNDLTPFPIPKMIQSGLEKGGAKLTNTPLEAVVITLFFIALLLYFSYRTLKTKDL